MLSNSFHPQLKKLSRSLKTIASHMNFHCLSSYFNFLALLMVLRIMLFFLRRDQQQVLAIVLQNIYVWLFGLQWSPLCLTVSGVAGSGKRTLIHTIVSTVRSIFQRNDVVRVCAPTGSAAFSAGGETIHRLFSIKVRNMTEILSATTQECLMQKFSNLVVLIVDERSMVGSELLAVIESFSHQTVHNGINSSHPWGLIPVIILVGDDHQLPPIYQGAFDAILPLQDRLRLLQGRTGVYTSSRIARGHHQFRLLARSVMYLTASRRVLSGQERLARILAGLRGQNGHVLDDSDVDFLCGNFHLMSPHFTEQDRKELCKDALFLFALKKPKQILNHQKLREIHSSSNPVARIKATTVNRFGKIVSYNSHYDNESAPPLVYLCIGAKVALTGQNICPEWGLFNGTIGIIMDIVFKEGESPNTNDLPLYVLVEFSLYKGPPFDHTNPKVIPIVPLTV